MTTAIDWTAIKEKWCQGRSFHSLAKEFGLTHPAIIKRKKAEGWERYQDQSVESKVPAIQPGAAGMLALGERTPENKAMVIVDLSSGLPVHLAAKCIGMMTEELESWAEDDQEIQVAAARGHARRALLINAAAERGDWKAAGWMMERHPDTRGDFGQKQTGGGGVTVVFNWSRDEQPIQPTVDVTPKPQ